MPLRLLRARGLPDALRSGRINRETVVRSVRRILATTLQHYADRDDDEPSPTVVASSEHRALAREVAIAGCVLLKNEAVAGEPMLPLPADLRRIAVIGALADRANIGDQGSSTVRPPSTVSVLQGFREVLPNTRNRGETRSRQS